MKAHPILVRLLAKLANPKPTFRTFDPEGGDLARPNPTSAGIFEEWRTAGWPLEWKEPLPSQAAPAGGELNACSCGDLGRGNCPVHTAGIKPGLLERKFNQEGGGSCGGSGPLLPPRGAGVGDMDHRSAYKGNAALLGDGPASARAIALEQAARLIESKKITKAVQWSTQSAEELARDVERTNGMYDSWARELRAMKHVEDKP